MQEGVEKKEENESVNVFRDHRVEAIKKYRIEECELTQAQMAKVFKVAQGRIGEIETGGSISKKMARKLSVLMEKPLEFFL